MIEMWRMLYNRFRPQGAQLPATCCGNGTGTVRRVIGREIVNTGLIMAHHWVYPALLDILESEWLARPPILRGGSDSVLAASLFVTSHDVDCVNAGIDPGLDSR